MRRRHFTLWCIRAIKLTQQLYYTRGKTQQLYYTRGKTSTIVSKYQETCASKHLRKIAMLCHISAIILQNMERATQVLLNQWKQESIWNQISGARIRTFCAQATLCGGILQQRQFQCQSFMTFFTGCLSNSTY